MNAATELGQKFSEVPLTEGIIETAPQKIGALKRLFANASLRTFLFEDDGQLRRAPEKASEDGTIPDHFSERVVSQNTRLGEQSAIQSWIATAQDFCRHCQSAFQRAPQPTLWRFDSFLLTKTKKIFATVLVLHDWIFSILMRRRAGDFSVTEFVSRENAFQIAIVAAIIGAGLVAELGSWQHLGGDVNRRSDGTDRGDGSDNSGLAVVSGNAFIAGDQIMPGPPITPWSDEELRSRPASPPTSAEGDYTLASIYYSMEARRSAAAGADVSPGLVVAQNNAAASGGGTSQSSSPGGRDKKQGSKPSSETAATVAVPELGSAFSLFALALLFLSVIGPRRHRNP
jgi:hypothetical protein